MSQGHPGILMHALTADALLEEAFGCLCRQRTGWPDSADIWTFRRHWHREKARLQQELRAGTYLIGLLTRTSAPCWAPCS